MNTNEFWADGMRVGKAVGFKNGIEAAAKLVDDAVVERWNGERFRLSGVAKAIRALSQPREPTPSHAVAPCCAKCGGPMEEASHLKCQSCGRVAPVPSCAPAAAPKEEA